MIANRRLLVGCTVVAMLGGGLSGVAGVAGAAVPNAPSALCHVTDGSFDTCPDGSTEWSDVTPAHFDATDAFLYSDQADLDPAAGIPGSPVDTLMLMYDECAATAPLGRDDYFLISFDSVEGAGQQEEPEQVERYTVHVFSDGTIIFFLNGVAQTDENGRSRVAQIEGQRGRAGFGPSPGCPSDHLVVEYQVRLAAADTVEVAGVTGGAPSTVVSDAPRDGEGYSPDPLYWSSTPPRDGKTGTGDRDRDGVADELDNCPNVANPNQADGDLNGIGDACGSPERRHATAAFVQAGPDGQTGVAPTGTGLGEEPDLADRLVHIVGFRVDAGLAKSAEELTHNLVTSLVRIGLVTSDQAAELERTVLSRLDKAPR